MKKAYLAKRGKGSLVSKDKTVEIRPAGGIYDGVDLSVAKFLMEGITYHGLTLFREEDGPEGQARFTLRVNEGSGGGGDIDPDKLRKLIIEYVDQEIRKVYKVLDTDLQKK